MYGLEFEIPAAAMDPNFLIPIGKAKVMRQGKDVTIVAFSRPVGMAMQAAAELEKKGISCEVINLRSIRPLDTDTIIESVKKTHRLVTVELGWPNYGVGSEILASLVESEGFDYLDANPIRICGADVPMPYAENLENFSQPQVKNVIEMVQRLVKRPSI